MNSSLYAVFSSKFVEPVHSMSSVAFLFVVQSSSILYPRLASPLFVSMLLTSSDLVHHLFVVECTSPFLVGHVRVSSMDLPCTSSLVLDSLSLDVELLSFGAVLGPLLVLLVSPQWEASFLYVGTVVLVVCQLWIVELLSVLALWLQVVMVLVVCCLEGVFPFSLSTMFLRSSWILEWPSSVASCRGLDMLLQ